MSAVEPRPADDAGWAAAARAALAGDDAAFAARFDAGEDIDRLLAARTRAVDDWVRQAWERCIGAEPTDLALFAVGGYGRGELFPHSDIDLLVLAEPEAQQTRHDALARLFALLWDAGLSYPEIAAQTGLAVGAVGTTLARARRRLVDAHDRQQKPTRDNAAHS